MTLSRDRSGRCIVQLFQRAIREQPPP